MSKSVVIVSFAVTLAGVAVREIYHAAATRFFIDYWSGPGDPSGAPKCKFDCTLSVPQETWLLGVLGLALILAGPAILFIERSLNRK